MSIDKKAIVQRLGQVFSERHDPKGWAWRLKAREESGERLTKAQRDMWRAALRVELEVQQ